MTRLFCLCAAPPRLFLRQDGLMSIATKGRTASQPSPGTLQMIHERKTPL
ncbi:MAG: hypothetical protein ABIZ04_26895 [Opitutus sp.]